jgi:hypothetical protein
MIAAVLAPLYLGALVFGGVLLAAALLVGDRSRLRIRSLRFAGFVLAGFGLTTVAVRAAGVLDESTTAVAGAVAAAVLGAIVLLLGRPRNARR